MKNRKNRLISTILAFLLPAGLAAQVPADFTHIFDSVQFVATPLAGGDQVVEYNGSGTFSIKIPEGHYQVYISANKNAKTFDSNLRFSQVFADTIDTAVVDSMTVKVVTPQFLILVPRKYDRPLVNDGRGSQPLFFESTNYWYVYVTRTSIDQVFSFNPRTGGTPVGNKYIHFTPVSGTVLVYVPPTQTLNVSIEDPFK